jgi:hypothetical protein
MGDRFDREAETRRVTFAAEQVARHADRELALLIGATEAASEARARELEAEAARAYRDFVALIKEHGLER